MLAVLIEHIKGNKKKPTLAELMEDIKGRRRSIPLQC